MKPLLSIQYLRAFAALSVALFHEAESSGKWFSIGAAGVDIFFVISGFIMFIVTEEKESNPKIFFWRRLTRIVPLYWCVTLLTMFIVLIRPHLIWGVDISFSHVIPSLFFISHTNNLEKNWPVVLQGWTLNIEMFFYIVVAIALFLPRRMQLPLISLLLIALVMLGAVFNPQSVVLQTYTNNLLLEFVAGLWLGYWSVLGKLPTRKTGMVLLGLGFLALAVNPLLPSYQLEYVRPLYWGMPAIFIVLGALSIETKGSIVYVPFLKLLGDSSYSIYLLHGIAEAVINRLPLPLLLKAPLSIIAVISVGIMAFKWLEKPVNAKMHQIRIGT